MLINKIFVYGSLRSDMFNYKIYLDGKVKNIQPGYIKGRLAHIDNKGYPAVTKGNNKIIGELMELTDFESTLALLDEMEHYIPNGDNNEYNRKEIIITLLDGSTTQAYYYEYNLVAPINANDVLIAIDSGDWKQYMLSNFN